MSTTTKSNIQATPTSRKKSKVAAKVPKPKKIKVDENPISIPLVLSHPVLAENKGYSAYLKRIHSKDDGSAFPECVICSMDLENDSCAWAIYENKDDVKFHQTEFRLCPWCGEKMPKTLRIELAKAIQRKLAELIESAHKAEKTIPESQTKGRHNDELETVAVFAKLYATLASCCAGKILREGNYWTFEGLDLSSKTERSPSVA